MKLSAISISVALALLAGAASPVSAGIFEDLQKKMESAPQTVHFPDRQDQALTRIKFQPDQLIYLWREAQTHRQGAAEGNHLQTMLFEALTQKHLAHCWKFTKQIRKELDQGEEKQQKRFVSVLDELLIREDLGAFAPVFQRIERDLPEGLVAHVQASEEAVQALEDPARLAHYIQAVSQDKEFYTRRRGLGRLWDKARKGVEGLLDRMETRFSQENLVRFFTRLGQSRFSDEVKNKAREARSQLEQRLVEEVLEDFDDQLEGGIGEGYQSILEGGGFVQTKTILLRGRLRILVKLMQELKQQPQDLALFMGPLKQIHRGIRQRRMLPDLDQAGREYVAKVDKTLDNTEVILGLLARKATPGSGHENLWRAVFEALTAEDFEGIFAEMKEHPESF